MKNVVVRSLSGIVYVALILFCTFYGSYWFLALGLLLGIGGMVELFRLADNGTEQKKHPLIFALDLMAGVVLITSQFYPLYPLLLLYFPVRLISELYTRDTNPSSALGRSFLALAYVAVPIAALMYLREVTGFGLQIVLAMFILIWVSDTGAFCVGCLFGKHRLFERISPKKSWEGFFGGMAFCIAACLVMKYCFPIFFNNIPLQLMLILGVAVPVAATLGDLVESMLKRAAGVKDSGNIMPGHGGFLDRTDSLLVVAPVVLVIFCLFLFFII